MKTKLQPSQKLNLKPVLMYAFAGIIGAVLVGIGTFFYLSVGPSQPVVAAPGDVITSIGITDANWNNTAGWDLGRRPENGDRVIIQAGHRRTINVDLYFNGEIIVNGELRIWNRDLIMDATSKVAINDGGQISFSPLGNILGFTYKTANLMIGRSYHWLVGWYGGELINDPVSGPIAFGDGGNELLPIELITFDAKIQQNKKVTITWSTASEENNDFFTVERSLDGKNYFTLDTIDGAGTSNSVKKYAYTDDLPAAGTNYYRLKQTDYDGKFEYFKIVSIYNESNLTELEMVTIGPNPYRDHFKVNFFSGDKDSVHLKLMDMTGKTVFTKSLEAEVGNNSFIYHDEQNLKPGIYIFTIMQKGVSAKTFRIVKNS